MKPHGHIKNWEWSRAFRWYIQGISYSEISRRSGRSRSTIAAHGKKYKWEEQRRAIRAIRSSASIEQCLRYLTHSEAVLLEYVQKLQVAQKLEQVQRVKASLQ